MARFRSTPVGTNLIQGEVNSRRVKKPDFYNLEMARTSTNAGGAAGIVSVGAIFDELRGNSPDMGTVVKDMAKLRTQEKIESETAAAFMEQAGIRAAGEKEIGKIEGKAYDKAGAEAEKSGTISAIANIASKVIPLAIASDEDTKHTIDELDNACETLRQLKPVTFYYKEEYSQYPERMHYGFIAQEYQKVMPDATYTDSTTGKLCIDPIELIGLLVRANQELEIRVTRMEAKQVLQAV